MSAMLDVEKCRAQFPALKDNYLFADNAGGSQVSILNQQMHVSSDLNNAMLSSSA